MRSIIILVMVLLMAIVAAATDGPMSYVYICQEHTPALWYSCLVHEHYGTIKRVPCYSKGEAIMVAEMMSDRWNIPFDIHHVTFEN